MKFVESMTVYDAVKKVNKLEEILNNKNRKYIGVTVSNPAWMGGPILIDTEATLNKDRIINLVYKHRWDTDNEQYLKNNMKDTTHYIDCLYKLKTAIKEFNDNECIIIGASKITISEALMLIDKLTMEREFYLQCVTQYESITDNKRNLENIAYRDYYFSHIKILNPNKIGSNYHQKVYDLDKRIKKLNSKINRKWENGSIKVEISDYNYLLDVKHMSRD